MSIKEFFGISESADTETEKNVQEESTSQDDTILDDIASILRSEMEDHITIDSDD